MTKQVDALKELINGVKIDKGGLDDEVSESLHHATEAFVDAVENNRTFTLIIDGKGDDTLILHNMTVPKLAGHIMHLVETRPEVAILLLEFLEFKRGKRNDK